MHKSSDMFATHAELILAAYHIYVVLVYTLCQPISNKILQKRYV